MAIGEISRNITVATVADSLQDAFTFVMTNLDDVGDDPCIEISPIWVYYEDGHDDRKFQVSVSGDPTPKVKEDANA